ncbi:MAG: ABC transporter substrate-binding protein [bacterium]|nr:ABC transporter substrate-binding protein [bacterium]
MGQATPEQTGDAPSRDRGVNRRDVMKTAAAGIATGAFGVFSGREARAAHGNRVQVKIAGYAYDRVRAIQDGRLGVDGCDLSFHVKDIYRLNAGVFGSARTYEVSETGLIPYVKKYANEDFRAYTLIPVFISRMFRHRDIYIRPDRGIEKPEDLRGKRIGTPGYGMSASTWTRGFLQDMHGVKPDEMRWVETTKSSDGGTLSASIGSYVFPDGFPFEKGPPGVDESEMIIAGDVDALISATTPRAFLDRNPNVKRLFPDFRSAEQAYYKKARVFPIMHAIAIRKDFADANPGLPGAIFSMYSRAKQAAYDDLETTTALKVTLPWATQEFLDTQKLMGDNYWPYGIEANRTELELIMRYTYEQGLAKRRLDVEEIFHPSTLQLTETSE